MSFGERITYIRGSLSQEDFGVLLGAHRNSVRAWGSNNGMPRKEIINQLQKIFSEGNAEVLKHFQKYPPQRISRKFFEIIKIL